MTVGFSKEFDEDDFWNLEEDIDNNTLPKHINIEGDIDYEFKEDEIQLILNSY